MGKLSNWGVRLGLALGVALLGYGLYTEFRKPECREITRVSVAKAGFSEVWMLRDCEGVVHSELERTIERPAPPTSTP